MAVMQNDPFAPNFQLIINNVKMNDDFMKLIESATFEDESEFISSLSFTIRYKRSVKEGVSDDILKMKVLSPGNLVILRGGYGNDLQDIGAGYITDLEPDFRDGEDPSMRVVCYSQLQKLSLRKPEKGEVFKGRKDSQIAIAIGERNGFVIKKSDAASLSGIRTTTGQKLRTQKRGSSDLDFMKELAKLNNYDLYDKWDGKLKKFLLFFEPSKDRTKEVMSFIYGDGTTPVTATEVNGKIIQTLKSFRPTFSITSQFTKYKVFSWDKKTEKKISYVLTMDEFMAQQEDLKLGGVKADGLLKKNAATSGAGVQKKGYGDITEVISTRTFHSEKEAKEYLINHMKKVSKDFITGSGSISGNQYLQSRQVHEFKGLGAFFEGKYFLKKVTHKFTADGYVSDFEVRKTLRENM